jgi:Tfp pilus assembly protein FimT
MRGLSLLDLLIILAVLALLLFVARKEFARYEAHTLVLPAATPQPDR